MRVGTRGLVYLRRSIDADLSAGCFALGRKRQLDSIGLDARQLALGQAVGIRPQI